MHRRLLAWGLTGSVIVTVLGACAALSGLDQYSGGHGTGDGCTDCTTSPDDTGLSEQQQQPPADDSSSDTVDWMTADEGTPDAPEDTPFERFYSDIVEGPRDAVAGGPGPDATGNSGEAGPAVDAGHDAAADAPPDVAVDAAPDAPSCNASSCGGCCTAAGLCAAGGLTSACGTGGAACQSCSSGNVCSAGSCVPPPADAGDSGSGCHPTTCANLCVPYFVQCCKSDQSCGCALLFPPGPCN